MGGLSARQHRFDSRLRQAALADAGTVPQVNRMVAASAQAEPNQRVHRRPRSERPVQRSEPTLSGLAIQGSRRSGATDEAIRQRLISRIRMTVASPSDWEVMIDV